MQTRYGSLRRPCPYLYRRTRLGSSRFMVATTSTSHAWQQRRVDLQLGGRPSASDEYPVGDNRMSLPCYPSVARCQSLPFESSAECFIEIIRQIKPFSSRLDLFSYAPRRRRQGVTFSALSSWVLDWLSRGPD